MKFREQFQQENVIHVRITKTFKTVANEMIENSSDIKYSTVKTDMDILKKVNLSIGDKLINVITSKTLQQLIHNLEEQYSERYIKNIYYTINKVFKYAIFKDYIKVNPLEKVKQKIDKDSIKEEMLFWEPSDFEIFIDHIDNIEMRAFFIFSFWMGTRRSETLALQWKDIDWKYRSVHIYKTVTHRAKGTSWAITTPKRKNSIRVIMMPQIVIDSLQKLYDMQKVMYAFSKDVYLFGYYRPMGLDRPRRYLKNTIKMINENNDHILPDIRVHDLRHSHASYLINNMSDQFTVYDIAKRIGDTVDTVFDTYAHWFKDANRKVVNAIDQQVNTSDASGSSSSYLDELKQLKELLDLGILTENEFVAKKKKISDI